MTRQAFEQILTRFIERAGSQRAAAQQLGVSAQYLCDVLKGRRAPGSKILEPLGLKRVVGYASEKATS